MRIAVKDSSILIDLAEADLLGLWIQLKIETHATDFVLHEVSRGQQWAQISPFVDAGLLQRHAAYSGRIRTLIPIQSGHRSGGIPDSRTIQFGQCSDPNRTAFRGFRTVVLPP